MIAYEVLGFFSTAGQVVWKIIIVLAGSGFVALMIYITLFPFFRKKKITAPEQPLHPESKALTPLQIPSYNKIAIALDFSLNDQKLLAHAISQGKVNTRYLLIHVVESASARFLGKDSDDFETRTDEERLQQYILQLEKNGFSAEGKLGFRDRAREIARLVKEENADLLIIGAHGHSGIKDWLYGETIESVRHELKIPVLIVNF